MFECPEKSSFCLKVVLRDSQGNPLTPIDEMAWWVGNPGSDELVVDKTVVEDPQADMDIIIPKGANICESGRDEDRFIILYVRSGVHEVHRQYDYELENLNLVPYEGA